MISIILIPQKRNATGGEACGVSVIFKAWATDNGRDMIREAVERGREIALTAAKPASRA